MDYSLLLCVETNWSKEELNRMALQEAEEKVRKSNKQIDLRKSISEEKRKIKECIFPLSLFNLCVEIM